MVISSSSNDHNRKRPLIVFDGSSSHSGPLKVKKAEGTTVSTGITDRLKPPPAANLSNPIRKLSSNTSSSSIHCSTDTANLKREANSSVGTCMYYTEIYCTVQGKCALLSILFCVTYINCIGIRGGNHIKQLMIKYFDNRGNSLICDILKRHIQSLCTWRWKTYPLNSKIYFSWKAGIGQTL